VGPESAQQAVSDAIPSWFERELCRISAMMDEEMAASLKDYGRRAVALIESIRKDAAALFEIPYHAPEGEQVYQSVRKPYWVDHEWESSFSPVSSAVIECILPGSLREHRAKNRLEKQIDILVMRNMENLRYETLQNIDTGFRMFGRDLDTNLHQTIEATQGAIRSALEERKRYEETISSRLDELEKNAQKIQDLISPSEAV
jgi:hypothetical protein